MIRVGLRFQRADGPILRALAARARHGELGQSAVTIFSEAAQAAETGEPLIVRCTDAQEAKVLAAGYVQYGVSHPALEELTGDRPSR